MAGTVEFEGFRRLLIKGLADGDGAKGVRSYFEPVTMFRVLGVQVQHDLSRPRKGS